MSYFKVLVVTPDGSDKSAHDALQPFHEFECTGIDDEYVSDIDETDERRSEYDRATTPRYRDQAGALFDPFEDRFYRDPAPEEARRKLVGIGCGGGISWTSKDWGDGRGYRAKVHYIPDGFTEINVPSKELYSFSEYLERDGVRYLKHKETAGKDHQYGYAQLDENGNVIRVITRTNKNSKWDWWKVGGRYEGNLLDKYGKKHNSLRKRDIDFMSMLHARHIVHAQIWSDCKKKYNANPFDGLSFEYARQKMRDQTDEAIASRGDRALHQAIDAIPRARELRTKASFEDDGLPDEAMDGISFIASARPLSAFAFLMDGKWTERGEMGWWGCVSNEKDQKDWVAELTALIGSVPKNHWITVVDCHI